MTSTSSSDGTPPSESAPSDSGAFEYVTYFEAGSLCMEFTHYIPNGVDFNERMLRCLGIGWHDAGATGRARKHLIDSNSGDASAAAFFGALPPQPYVYANVERRELIAMIESAALKAFGRTEGKLKFRKVVTHPDQFVFSFFEVCCIMLRLVPGRELFLELRSKTGAFVGRRIYELEDIYNAHELRDALREQLPFLEPHLEVVRAQPHIAVNYARAHGLPDRYLIECYRVKKDSIVPALPWWVGKP